MNYVALSADVATGDPPANREDVGRLAEEQFHSILNLQTLGEEGVCPSRDEAIYAQQAGLIYLNFPIADSELDDFHLDAFRTKLKLLPPPTYVHAAQGPRASVLSLIDHALHHEWSADRALQFANEQGISCGDELWETLIREYVDHAG